MINAAEIDGILKTFTILVDTREHPNSSYLQRLSSMGVPFERKKLDFGDYSAKCRLPDGKEYSLEKAVCVERKMSFDELCSCYCQQRKRFVNEFQRAKDNNAKIYLLVENGSWEAAYKGDYNSLMKPQALVASLTAWLARYNCQIIFCKPNISGRLIKELLYREMKERLENGKGL